jgi:putative ABC transport system permease protein
VLDAVIFVVGIATALALALVFALSLRLRQREISTLFRLGGSRLTTARLLIAEIAIIVTASAALCGVLLLAVHHYSGDLVHALFIR